MLLATKRGNERERERDARRNARKGNVRKLRRSLCKSRREQSEGNRVKGKG